MTADFRTLFRLENTLDVAAQETWDHRRAAHANQFRVRRAQCEGFEDVILPREATGQRDVRRRNATIVQHLAVLVRLGMQVQ